MALVNIDSVLRNLLQKLKKLKPPQGVELLSYKRNRSIAVLLLDDEKILVLERGYRDEEQIIEKSLLPNHLKKLIKYEFPRSRKVRVCPVDSPLELEKTRKIL